MKTRNGFVSNSSSTSFIIVCTIQDHKKAVAKLHPYYQKRLSKMEPQKKKFLDKDILVFSGILSSEEEAMEWDGEYPPEAEDYDDGDGNKMVPSSEIVNIYVNELKKVSKNVIDIWESC